MSYNLLAFTDQQGMYTNPPLPEKNHAVMHSKLVVYGDKKFATEYMASLLLSNGVQIENVILFDDQELCAQLAENNKYIEFGTNGNIDALIYSLTDQAYQIVNTFDFSDIFRSFDSLSELIDFLLVEQGVVVET